MCCKKDGFNTLCRLLSVLLVLLAFTGNIYCQSSRSESDFIYAKRLFDDGLYDLAAEALENYLATFKDSPHSAEASMLIGEARWNEENYEAARTAFQNVAMNHPNDPLAIKALFKVANCYSAIGDVDKNIRALLRIPVFYPGAVEAPVALVQAASLLIENDRWADAEAPLQQVIQQYIHSPQVIDARMLWARVLANRGDLESAIEEASRVVGQTEDKKLAVESLGLQGEWYSRLGRDAEAEASWQKILNDYPGATENASALIHMAQRRLRIGDAEKAEPLFRQALEADLPLELKHDANLGMGDALFILGRYEASLAFYNNLNSDDDNIKFREALAYEKNDQPNEALLNYDEIVRKDSSKILIPVSYWRSGVILQELGRYREAVDKFKNAEELFDIEPISSESAYRKINNLKLQESDATMSAINSFLMKYQEVEKVDDVAWLKISLLKNSKDYKEALKELKRFKINYPLSPFINKAETLDYYITTYKKQDGDPSAKVAGLLAEVAGGLDRNIMSKRLGVIYLEEYKDFNAAEQQFRIVLSDTSINEKEKREVNRLLAEALWRKYEYATYNDQGEQIDYKGNDAINISSELIKSLYEIKDPEQRAKISYCIIKLGLESRKDEVEKIKYIRDTWQEYLADYPGSPNNPEILLDLAEAFSIKLEEDTLQAGEDSAVWYLGTIINEYPDSKILNTAHLRLSERYLAIGDTAKAIDQLKILMNGKNSIEKISAVISLLEMSSLKVNEIEKNINWLQYEAFYNPDVRDIKMNMLTKLIDIGKYEKAYALIEDMEAYHPEMGAGLVIQGSQVHKIAFIKGLVFEGLDQKEKARENFQLFLAYHPDDVNAPKAHLHLARMRHEMGYIEAAMSHYKWLLDNTDENELKLSAYRGMSKVYFEKGNYEEAKRWSEAAESNDLNSQTAMEYGELKIVSLLKMGRLSDANAAIDNFNSKYRESTGIDNANARFLLEKGKYLSKMNNYRDSSDNYRRLYKKYPDSDYSAEAKYELGRDYLELKKYDDALEILTAMPTDYPGHPVIGKVYWVLGNYYVSNGNVMDGISTYDKVLSDSTYIEVWPFVFLNQIRAYKQAGFYAGGLQAVQRYLELYPDAPDAFDRQMDIGTMYQQLGQYDIAISQFRKIQPMANVEDEAACQFYIAESLEKSGRLAEAVIEYKKVDYLGKRTKMQWAVTALYSAGRVLERLGEEENAIDMYKEIVKREGLGSPFGRKAQEQIIRIEKSKEE